jgi:predicted glycogen debranching enzyme
MDFARATQLEWIETNGLGGWASSTACGANTRRYHGVLVAAQHPPVGREVLLSKLDERVTIDGATYDLGTNQFPGAVHPHGYEHLVNFTRDLFPVFDYEIGGVQLRKTIAAIHGDNTTVITYEASRAIALELRPLVADRDYHSLRSAGLKPGLRFFIDIPNATFSASDDWWYRFEYAMEIERGLDAHEDLFSPGTYSVSGARIAIIVSTDDPRGRDGFALLAAERERREAIAQRAPIRGSFGRTLALAADQFVVRRGNDRRTIIAGYHWFTDWGRDTMISLPGLCLVTGRLDDASSILLAFAEAVSEGMLPNRFPDFGEAPEYNTADATLWFFVAVKKYLDAGGDASFVRQQMLPVLRDIIAWHERGTRHNIHEDRDGLLIAGEPGVQLTWMDARVGDWVVTPRHGKSVEINALWFNALMILSDLEKQFGSETASFLLAIRAGRARDRFRQIFWNADGGYLYDVINDAMKGNERDASIRPNQIFALSLPHPLLDGIEAESVLSIVETHLLTPVGLRTLSFQDPRFRPHLIGPPLERDGAYHQGTVWPWLLGPFITAIVRYRGEAGITEGMKILTAFEPHLAEAGVGSISEVFDGAPPHTPRGCIAQAWSVAEVLRAAVEDLRFE